ncbi:uncharacterized protein DS421_14g453600 [Arachis hypogaea]|nr:uncharacterized protein DS421_14g453600 [Arachis hypogaea]
MRLSIAQGQRTLRPHLFLPRRVSHTLPPPNAIFPYLREAGFGDTVPLRFTFDNSLIRHSWSDGVRRPTRSISHGVRSPSPCRTWRTTSGYAHTGTNLGAAQRKELFSLKLVWMWDNRRLSDDEQVEQLGPSVLATAASGLRAVPGVVLGLGCAGLDVPVTVLDSIPRRHEHRWLHSAFDFLDIPEIFPVVSTRIRDFHVSYGCEDCSSRAKISMRGGFCTGEWRQTSYDLMRLCAPLVDQVKRQFNGEQPDPGAPVNLDRFLTSNGRGEDMWWPDRLHDWYSDWSRRFEAKMYWRIPSWPSYQSTSSPLPASRGMISTFLGEFLIGIGMRGRLGRTPSSLLGGRGVTESADQAKGFNRHEDHEDIPSSGHDSPPPPPSPPPPSHASRSPSDSGGLQHWAI